MSKTKYPQLGPRGERVNLSRQELIFAAVKALRSEDYIDTNTQECIDKLNEVVAYVKERKLSGEPLEEDKMNGFKIANPLDGDGLKALRLAIKNSGKKTTDLPNRK